MLALNVYDDEVGLRTECSPTSCVAGGIIILFARYTRVAQATRTVSQVRILFATSTPGNRIAIARSIPSATQATAYKRP